MTDNEIINDFEKEIKYVRENEKYDDFNPIVDIDLCEDILDLIHRKNAEIERLKDENKSIRYCYEQAKSYNDTLAESCEKNCKKFNMTTRAEAIKEFAERLKEKLQWDVEFDNKFVFECDIDNLVKEMTEVEK